MRVSVSELKVRCIRILQCRLLSVFKVRRATDKNDCGALQVLYPLSYLPMVGRVGFEPATTCPQSEVPAICNAVISP